jgi:neutral trehalase
MQATEKQLASLAKARATRAAKKTGTTVAVAVASPNLGSDPKKKFNRASPEQRTAMLAALTDTQNYKRKGTVGPRMQATEKQLASLAKARATRAAKKTGTTVSVAVAAPAVKRTRARLTQEQKALKEQEKANKKIAREQKKANMAQIKADKVLAKELAKAAKPQKKKAKMD